MKRHIMGIIFFLMISSCDRETTKYTDIKIGDVEIITQSNSLENSDEMREVCESFKLSKSQVITYYYESRESTESEIHDSYNILPCNSTGSIMVNGEKYSWLIRAGGVGAFYNKSNSSLRVCGDNCCKLIKGIC